MTEQPKTNQPPTYRAYRVTATGRVQGAAVVLDASNDEQAIEQAKRLVDGMGVEVWDRARRVVVLPPNLRAVS